MLPSSGVLSDVEIIDFVSGGSEQQRERIVATFYPRQFSGDILVKCQSNPTGFTLQMEASSWDALAIPLMTQLAEYAALAFGHRNVGFFPGYDSKVVPYESSLLAAKCKKDVEPARPPAETMQASSFEIGGSELQVEEESEPARPVSRYVRVYTGHNL